MKIQFSLLLPLLLLSSIATGQAERTFVKSFSLQNKQNVVLNLGENVQIMPWDNDIMRVQMTVSLAATNDATLKALAETGRYSLKSEPTTDAFAISVPQLQTSVKLNGNAIREVVSYIIYVPKNVTIAKNIVSNAVAVTKLQP